MIIVYKVNNDNDNTTPNIDQSDNHLSLINDLNL